MGQYDRANEDMDQTRLLWVRSGFEVGSKGPEEVSAGSWLRGLLEDVLLVLFLVYLTVLSSGCCWFSKRSCFPPCESPTRVVVEMERPCELPPQLVLDTVKRSVCPDKPDWVCFEPREGGKLAANLANLKTWIREARARCGLRPESRPTSRPASPPASGVDTPR